MSSAYLAHLWSVHCTQCNIFFINLLFKNRGVSLFSSLKGTSAISWQVSSFGLLEQWTAGTAARGVGSSEIGHKDTFNAQIKIRKKMVMSGGWPCPPTSYWVSMETQLFSISCTNEPFHNHHNYSENKPVFFTWFVKKTLACLLFPLHTQEAIVVRFTKIKPSW